MTAGAPGRPVVGRIADTTLQGGAMVFSNHKLAHPESLILERHRTGHQRRNCVPRLLKSEVIAASASCPSAHNAWSRDVRKPGSKSANEARSRSGKSIIFLELHNKIGDLDLHSKSMLVHHHLPDLQNAKIRPSSCASFEQIGHLIA